MSDFSNYSDIILNSFIQNKYQDDMVSKKKSLLDTMFKVYKLDPINKLYVGFSPAILSESSKIYVTEISDNVVTFLKSKNIDFEYIAFDELDKYKKFFDSVIALDEYFTFADTLEEQAELIVLFSSITRGLLVTTMRDYKNMDFKERDFSSPLALYDGKSPQIYIEHHSFDSSDKTEWTTHVYAIKEDSMKVYGGFYRRSILFKQMARISQDAGSKNFLVQNNLMYKSLIKKNLEHVIGIKY